MDGFVVAAGSVTGRRHLHEEKGNQDAWYWRATDTATVAVVCDGCSAGAHSAFGATLAARLLVERLHAHLAALALSSGTTEPGPSLEDLLERARGDLLQHIESTAMAMGPDLLRTLADFFLFTVVGVVVTPARTAVFALGDGIFAVNGRLVRLGPFPGNAPPYLAYALVPPPLAPVTPAELRLAVHCAVPTAEVQSVLLGTDGAVDLEEAAALALPGTGTAGTGTAGSGAAGSGEPLGSLSQFWHESIYVRNPAALRRRLARANRHTATEPGLLPDDTTLVVVRRID